SAWRCDAIRLQHSRLSSLVRWADFGSCNVFIAMDVADAVSPRDFLFVVIVKEFGKQRFRIASVRIEIDDPAAKPRTLRHDDAGKSPEQRLFGDDLGRRRFDSLGPTGRQ